LELFPFTFSEGVGSFAPVLSVENTRRFMRSIQNIHFLFRCANHRWFNTTLIRRRHFDGQIVSMQQSGTHWLGLPPENYDVLNEKSPVKIRTKQGDEHEKDALHRGADYRDS
jgi:hypothetical protein